jgi:hypothetical protein
MQLRYRGISYPKAEITEIGEITESDYQELSIWAGSRQSSIRLSYRGVPYLKER